jgi:signal transduction histidine kinase
MMAMAREQPLPVDTEARLADFTELVATALANAENQAQLTASRARTVAAADQARRRIERDLHDGAQQRLVSLGLRLRAAQAAVPPEAIERAARFDGLADEVTNALDELRELARGIHPAALAQTDCVPRSRGWPAAPRFRSSWTYGSSGGCPSSRRPPPTTWSRRR